MSKLIQSHHEIDPKQVILEQYATAVTKVKVNGPSLLVAIYRRPEKTKGGIIRPESSLDEDIYQGKVGLVIKISHYPADEKELMHFDGQLPQVGDWVFFRASDGLSFGLLDKKGDCRFFTDRTSIKMIIEDPEMVW